LHAKIDRFGRVLVQPDLSIEGHPEVSVVGDLAALKDAEGKLVPGVAPAAIQMGHYVARKIRASLRNEPFPAFIYKDKGSLATIGRAAAVGYFGKRQVSGLVAWLAWLFIHIYFLIGFRNRVFVLLSWAWTYLGFQSGARLITYYNHNTKFSTPPESVKIPR
jgi:NADH dehydrogenase